MYIHEDFKLIFLTTLLVEILSKLKEVRENFIAGKVKAVVLVL
jgi:hypothetical protein